MWEKKFIDVQRWSRAISRVRTVTPGKRILCCINERSQIKQHRWPFPAEPGARIKPAQRPEVSGLIVEITVSEMALNFAGMFTVRGRPVQLASQTGWIGRELRSEMAHRAWRYIPRIAEECAQEVDPAYLSVGRGDVGKSVLLPVLNERRGTVVQKPTATQ